MQATISYKFFSRIIYSVTAKLLHHCFLVCVSIVHDIEPFGSEGNMNHSDFYYYKSHYTLQIGQTLFFSKTKRKHSKQRHMRLLIGEITTGHILKRAVCLLVSCLISQQHSSVPQGRICSENCEDCHSQSVPQGRICSENCEDYHSQRVPQGRICSENCEDCHSQSVPQGRICSENCEDCHNQIEVADQTYYLSQSPYFDAGPASPSAEAIAPGTWQSIHWSFNPFLTMQMGMRYFPCDK